MDMSLMILEADGSIRNPAIAWAVGIWAIILVIIAFFLARRFRRTSRRHYLILMAILAIATPVVVRSIATLFYVRPWELSVSVHFWGISPMQWLAPAVAVLMFAGVAFWPRRHVAAA